MQQDILRTQQNRDLEVNSQVIAESDAKDSNNLKDRSYRRRLRTKA